ncbi:MAG: ECF transporter S component [Lachnospiraceae bacterium]|nr:ECF transporter S component [Lachnospiraceae bacterium]
MNTETKLSTQKLCFIGLFGALSAVLMLFDFPLFFAPSFMKLDLAELPCILGGFMFGPLVGECIVVVKILLNTLMTGSSTMYVGELSNLILSSIYVLTASVIYKMHKTRKQAVLSLVAAVLAVSVIALISNTFFIFPAYAVIYGMSMETIVSMAAAVNPLVHDTMTMMLFSVFPFNLVKYGAVSIITFLVYKRLHGAISKIIR